MRGQDCGYKFERLKLKEIMGGKAIGERVEKNRMGSFLRFYNSCAAVAWTTKYILVLCNVA